MHDFRLLGELLELRQELPLFLLGLASGALLNNGLRWHFERRIVATQYLLAHLRQTVLLIIGAVHAGRIHQNLQEARG